MGAARMKPIVDETGRLRPDLDFRDVPASVMAIYFDVTPWCIWDRMMRGEYQGCIKRHGTVTYYRPRKIVGAA